MNDERTLYAQQQDRIAALEAELAERTRDLDYANERAASHLDDAYKLRNELAAERERREAAEKDAARYRGLREWRARWEIRYWNGIYWNQLTTDELDAAIDATIAAERGGK